MCYDEDLMDLSKVEHIDSNKALLVSFELCPARSRAIVPIQNEELRSLFTGCSCKSTVNAGTRRTIGE